MQPHTWHQWAPTPTATLEAPIEYGLIHAEIPLEGETHADRGNRLILRVKSATTIGALTTEMRCGAASAG